MFTLIYYGNLDSDEKREYIRQYQKETKAMFHPHDNFVKSERPRIRDMVKAYEEL